jgi:hypothetical protein
MKLPNSLSRKAIMDTFDRLEPVTWEKLFEREGANGIAKHRTTGDYPSRAYYRTEGIMEWLVRNGHYTVEQFLTNPKFGGDRPQQQPLKSPRLALSA